MLELYSAIATRLRRFSWLLWVLLAAAAGGFAATLLLPSGGRDELYTLSAVCVLAWAICLIVFTRVFAAPVPSIESAQGFFGRTRIRLRRAARWLMAGVVTILLIIVLGVSVRALGILI